MLLVVQALDETGGCLRFRLMMRGQADVVVRREYRDAVGGVVRWEEGPGGAPDRRGAAVIQRGRRKGRRQHRRRASQSRPVGAIERLPG